MASMIRRLREAVNDTIMNPLYRPHLKGPCAATQVSINWLGDTTVITITLVGDTRGEL